MIGPGFAGSSFGYDALTGRGVAMECAHEPCTCQVLELGELCSEACELGVMTGPFCGCEHAMCQTSRVRATAFD